MITPSSKVYFLNVPFSTSQNNIMNFASKSAQESYMQSKIVYSISDCKYIREGDGEYLRVGKVADSLYNCNYVMFQNTQFGSRWFYAFIEKIKYLNGNCSDCILKLDVMQTFMFDYEIKDTFIERQTFYDDYYNTLADTPSTGDLRTIWEYERPINGYYFILFNSDPTQNDTTNSNIMYSMIGDYSMPCYMAICTSPEQLSEVVQAVSNKGRADRIQACYYAPCELTADSYSLQYIPKGDLNISYDNIGIISYFRPEVLRKTFTLTIGVTPLFKKEFAYPYAKLEIVDKITSKYIELDLSKFIDPLNPQFTIAYNITDNVEYKVIPLNYNGSGYSIENSLVVEPLTDMPVFSNTYAKYAKDNRLSNGIGLVMAGAGIAGSMMVGNIAGAVGSFGSIAQTITADGTARKQPNQVSGIKGDSYEYINNSPSIYFRLKIMDEHHMQIARNFWNAYGYPERKIGTFENISDSRYNFVKTVGVNIIADTIPSEYQREIETILDKGVTFWNNSYLNYDIFGGGIGGT